MTEAINRQNGRAPRGMAALLAALSALGPFSIDTYLPSFHDIGDKLNASPLEVQQTLTAYLLPFAIMTLWHGALADRYGRRRVLLVTLALFGVASAGCLAAGSIGQLWFWRMLQGITAGAGTVVSRAVVRDLFDGPAAQRLMSQVSMMFALAPAIAPLIGGQLQTAFGWRSVFLFLTLATATLWLTCWRYLPETLPPEKRQSLRPADLAQSYASVLGARSFLLSCTALSAIFSAFFVYVLSAPVFLMKHLGLPATAFFWLFVPATTGMISGSWLSGRLAGRIERPATLRIAFIVMAVAASGNLTLNLFGVTTLPWVVMPLFVYTLGMSLAMPTLTLYALDPFPTRRGLASSCQTFLQASWNGIVAAAISPAVWGSLSTLALCMAFLLACGAIAAWRQQASRPSSEVTS